MQVWDQFPIANLNYNLNKKADSRSAVADNFYIALSACAEKTGPLS